MVTVGSLILAAILPGLNGFPPWITGPPSQPLATITITPTTIGATQSLNKLGSDLTVQVDMTAANVPLWISFDLLPLHLIRYTGDRSAQYHVYDDTKKSGVPNAVNPNPAYLADAVCLASFAANSGAATGFDNFMGAGAMATLGAKLWISGQYGCNYDGNGPADPNELAGWAAYTQTTYPGTLLGTTLGTEVYNCPTGSLCVDLHGTCSKNASGQCNSQGSLSGDPTTYADAYTTAQGIMHTTAPGIPLYVLGAPQKKPPTKWDTPVLAELAHNGTTPDGQEIECYLENVGSENDNYALGLNGSAALDCDNATISAGPTHPASLAGIALNNYPGLPIYVDQWALVSNSPGPQSQSIVAALFQAQQEMQFQLDPNIVAATYHTMWPKTCNHGWGTPPQFTQQPGIYGWQNSYGANVFGSPGAIGINNVTRCIKDTATAGTLMANAYALQVIANSVHASQHMIGATISPSGSVAVYAAQNGSGYALLLVNRNLLEPAPVVIQNAGELSGSGGTTLTYDRAQYDAAAPASVLCGNAAQCWGSFPPIAGTFGAWTGAISMVLQPGSITSVLIN